MMTKGQFAKYYKGFKKDLMKIEGDEIHYILSDTNGHRIELFLTIPDYQSKRKEDSRYIKVFDNATALLDSLPYWGSF